jgi:lipoprotein-anchoring transpeptidase ErfK/SrfK
MNINRPKIMFTNKSILILAFLIILLVGFLIVQKKLVLSKIFSLSEIVIVSPHRDVPTPENKDPSFHYIEIIDGCGPYYDTGTCVNMRSGPGVEYPVVGRLRNGVVLKVASTTTEGVQYWYKILFTTKLLYPERVKGDWYVAVDATSVNPLINIGDEELSASTTPTKKRIVVDISKEMIYAYDGDTLFMQEAISTGLDKTPTPRGDFKIFRKTPSRYMQGPIPRVSSQVYDLPGVPWNLYFTSQGDVIHGAYWHDHFGKPWSHGCVNLPSQIAKKLYLWADIGTLVHVQY